MTTPNTEPIPATDAEIAEIKACCEEMGRFVTLGHKPTLSMIARIKQEREMRRELKTALVRLSCHPCRFYTGTWVVCEGEDTSKMCDMCAAGSIRRWGSTRSSPPCAITTTRPGLTGG